MSQLSFAMLDYAAKTATVGVNIARRSGVKVPRRLTAKKKKKTKRDVFLAEMERVVPWARLEAVIEPHYPKASPTGGRRPFPLAVMLRIYLLQQWYQLSDPGAEEALYDIQSMRQFAEKTRATHSDVVRCPQRR